VTAAEIGYSLRRRFHDDSADKMNNGPGAARPGQRNAGEVTGDRRLQAEGRAEERPACGRGRLKDGSSGPASPASPLLIPPAPGSG
jgi:uncharacterized protein YjbJ (UPF0337 family)